MIPPNPSCTEERFSFRDVYSSVKNKPTSVQAVSLWNVSKYTHCASFPYSITCNSINRYSDGMPKYQKNNSVTLKARRSLSSHRPILRLLSV